ncbi:hypothetical protein NDU88_003449 [Pleurodeles waltl]|uniref:Uncharacterized protein n=1 Tax=Pleurodeles waltl TaxID=8319 RepID=A0AAV7MRP2_PLEWA|nr:hypothetical protein NDU88_003449 [Pleurodeles waltl]
MIVPGVAAEWWSRANRPIVVVGSTSGYSVCVWDGRLAWGHRLAWLREREPGDYMVGAVGDWGGRTIRSGGEVCGTD